MSETGLLNPASIRRIADQIGLRPTKTRGQNFVHDANTVRRIVSLAQVGAADRVIEVGPGLGSLTLGLLETGAEVVAIEIDEMLANQLPDTVAERMPGAVERLEVVLSDALDVKVIPGAEPTALVANLPYNVAVPVLLHMLAICPQWSTGVVMVQSEVADRLVADPGSKIYGVPSAKLAWYAEAFRVGNVPRRSSGQCPMWIPGWSGLRDGVLPTSTGGTRASPVPKSSALSTPLSPLAAKCCARPWPSYAVVQWRLPSSLPPLELTRRRVAKPSILAIWPALQRP